MKHDPTFPYELFRFLIRSIRDGDKDQGEILERFLERPQWWFEEFLRQVEEIPTLWDPLECREEWLRSFAAHVGWSLDLREILTLAASVDLRKLIILAVPLWKVKGTEMGIKDALRVFTGKSVGLDDFFDLRWITEEVHAEWITLPGGGPWVNGGGGGPFDEYVSDIYIQDSTSLNHALVEKLTEALLRPVLERYFIIYCALFELWDIGFSQWTIDSGVPEIENGRLKIIAGDKLSVLSPSRWSSEVFRFDFQFITPGVFRSFFYDLRPFGGTDYYYIEVTHATQTVDLYRFTFAGGLVLLSSFVNPISFGLARWGIMVRLQETAGGQDLEVYLDGDLKISFSDVVNLSGGVVGYEATLGRCYIDRPTVIEIPGEIVKVPSWL